MKKLVFVAFAVAFLIASMFLSSCKPTAVETPQTDSVAVVDTVAADTTVVNTNAVK